MLSIFCITSSISCITSSISCITICVFCVTSSIFGVTPSIFCNWSPENSLIVIFPWIIWSLLLKTGVISWFDKYLGFVTVASSSEDPDKVTTSPDMVNVWSSWIFPSLVRADISSSLKTDIGITLFVISSSPSTLPNEDSVAILFLTSAVICLLSFSATEDVAVQLSFGLASDPIEVTAGPTSFTTSLVIVSGSRTLRCSIIGSGLIWFMVVSPNSFNVFSSLLDSSSIWVRISLVNALNSSKSSSSLPVISLESDVTSLLTTLIFRNPLTDMLLFFLFDLDSFNETFSFEWEIDKSVEAVTSSTESSEIIAKYSCWTEGIESFVTSLSSWLFCLAL